MTILVSLLDDLEHVLRDSRSGPPDRMALLMRHSVRFPIENPADTFVVGLTEEGVRLAEELGELLGKRFAPGRLRSSPIGRCRATGEAIARGAGWTAKVRADRRLSHPYNELAWELVWRAQTGKANSSNGTLPGTLPEVLRWVTDNKHSRGTPRSAGDLQPAFQAYLPLMEQIPLLDVLVTHDTVVGAVAGALLHAPVTGSDWPGYLEGLLFWWSDGQVRVRWRGVEHVFDPEFTRIVSS